MVKIIGDKYILGQSKSKSINNNQTEIKLDLILKNSNIEITGASVRGKVKDDLDNPLVGASVQLISAEYELLMSTTTDTDGSYSLDNLPLISNSILYAFYPNKKIPKGVVFTPKPFQVTTIDFSLEIDTSIKLSIITGIIYDFTSGEPLSDAILYLYNIKDSNQIDDSSNEILLSVVRSNDEGYFIFQELPIGNYFVKATKLGYEMDKYLVNIDTQPKIVNLEFDLNANTNLENEIKGEISGNVQDERGRTFPNIDVVLYSVLIDGREIPIAYTQTNEEGFYIFRNVLKGNYKVKSNKTKMVTTGTDEISSTLVSPNFTKFLISVSSSYNVTWHDATVDKIQLLNGSIIKVNDPYPTVGNLGGSNNGRIKIFVNLPTDGFYIISIQYLSHNLISMFKLNVNNNSYRDIFVIDKTNGIQEKDIKEFSTVIKFNSGENIIELYNDMGNNTPNIRFTTYEFNGEIQTVNATEGRLFGTTVGLEETFVIGIGGPSIGSSDLKQKAYFEVDFYVFITDTYILNIEYISGDGQRPLKIDINGINFGGVYMVPETQGWFADNASIFDISVNLRAGKNTIKFYSDEDFVGPYIGNITCKTKFISYILEISKGNLVSGATLEINNTMVGNIGGPLNGAIVFKFYVLASGIYNMVIPCINNRVTKAPLKININGVNLGPIYTLPNSDLNNAINYIVQVNLEADLNIIKLYNDDGIYSPYIGSISLNLLSSINSPILINTTATKGKFNLGASLTFNGAMVDLGGGKKSVILPVELPSYGIYFCSVYFITKEIDGSPMSIYINDRLNNVVYLPNTNSNTIDDQKSIVSKSIFKGLNDKITFFNHTAVKSLNIGKIIMEKEVVFISNYALNKVELINGATLINDMIVNIGQNLGMIRLNVEVPKSGKYDLNISYLSIDNNAQSQINANFTTSDIIVDFETTNSTDIKDAKTKVVTLDLVQGLNIIQIYNS